jgi:D-glycero-alpha-D-manno-heptose-7-phosphate kinase
MIITRTPFRVSFFGGGTDYPPWYLENGGAVLSTSIDRYCYITCRRFPPFFPNTFRIVWSHIEPVSTIGEILHPAVREGLRKMGFDDSAGVEIHHQGDLPARSGMGSSSAFANGLILALAALRDRHISNHDLFHEAIDLEQNWIKDNVGSQDQVATAVGGLNVIHFDPGGAIRVEPVAMDPARKAALKERLMLFYSGGSRTASTIADTFVRSLSDRSAQLKRMHKMVFEARDILLGSGSLDAFGEMLHETWMMKRQLSGSVSNNHIDTIYDTARQAGAIGGKLLGAGGAGFVLVYADPEHHAAIRDALASLISVPFGFDEDGAKLLLQSQDLIRDGAGGA